MLSTAVEAAVARQIMASQEAVCASVAPSACAAETTSAIVLPNPTRTATRAALTMDSLMAAEA